MAILYISMFASLILGITVSVLNTKLLGPDNFGDYKFIQLLWGVSSVFITFGYFTTGGNLLAERKVESGGLVSALLIIAVIISVIGFLLLWLLSPAIGMIFREDLGEIVQQYAWLIVAFPIQLCLKDAFRGMNDIVNLSLINVLPHVLYITGILWQSDNSSIDVPTAIMLYATSVGAACAMVIARTRLSATSIRQDIGLILKQNRGLGFNIYIAVLVTTLTTQFSQFSIAYFYNTRALGEFALALTLTMPLTLISSAIATTFFKQFASSKNISKKVILSALVFSSGMLIVFLLVIEKVILLLYSEAFSATVTLAYICAIGAVIRGLGEIVNKFLLANRITVELRKNAIQLGTISIFGYVILVMNWGTMGAAITKLIVDILFFISMCVFYIKAVKQSV